MKTISVIDSHTGGEPTRIIVAGGPELGSGPMRERVKTFQSEFDEFRTAVIGEPRGCDIIVGGIICEPVNPAHSAGVIFFDNAGYLGMCGHGTIGLMVTLGHIGKIQKGEHKIETPVGLVSARLIDDNTVQFKNVPSYRTQKNVELPVPGHGTVVGDVVFGGNWFFLVNNNTQELSLANSDRLLQFTKSIRSQLSNSGITGDAGASIDHIELHAVVDDGEVDSRSFVLCPGGAYDRSPCGTGTSAKLACLAADGLLQPGQVYRQQSIVGSIFEGSFEMQDDKVIPIIKGSAFVSGESKLILNPVDPFCFGIRQ